MGRPTRFGSRSTVVPLAVVAVLAALGVPFGWLWATLAPEARVVAVGKGRGLWEGVLPTEPQPEEFFAADGWFVLLGLAFGLLAAFAVWGVLRHRRGPVALVALTLGMVIAGVLAWWVGQRIGLSGFRSQVREAAPGTLLDRPPDLRAKRADLWLGFIPRIQGDVLLPALAAVIAYTMLAAWSRQPSLRPEEETTAGSGQGAGAGPAEGGPGQGEPGQPAGEPAPGDPTSPAGGPGTAPG